MSTKRLQAEESEPPKDDNEPNNNDDDSQQQQQPTNFRLLLHAVDGVVPYLTPALLKRCFPVAEYKDILWMGMAVRDTCVVPVFDNSKKKARGYTFSSTTTTTKVDTWMQPYTRVTVPTFCLVDDNVAVTKKTKNPAATEIICVTDKHVMLWTPNGRLPLTPDLYIKATAATNGLQSQLVVSLFDTIPPRQQQQHHSTSGEGREGKMDIMSKTTRSKLVKREQAAIRRTQEWHQQHVKAALALEEEEEEQEEDDAHNTDTVAAAITAATTSSTTSSSTRSRSRMICWSPLVLDEHQSNETLDAQIDAVLKQQNKSQDDDDDDEKSSGLPSSSTLAPSAAAGAGAGAGVALIGWSHLSFQKQASVMNRLLLLMHDNRNGHRLLGSNVAVLSTQSLKQILQAARLGVNVIGSNLPTVWARNKMAFIVDIISFAWNNGGDDDTTTTTLGEPVTKRPRVVENDDKNDPGNSKPSSSSSSTSSRPKLNHDGCLELSSPASSSSNDNNVDITRQHPWFRDARPMLPGCTCHACTTHSRAYIYHLVCAKELLAEMLLFIHNLHHLLALMRLFNDQAAAAATKTDKSKSCSDAQQQQQQQQQKRLMEALIQHIESQLGDDDDGTTTAPLS